MGPVVMMKRSLGAVLVFILAGIVAGAPEESGKYKHDPAGDKALPYKHDARGDTATPYIHDKRANYKHDPRGDKAQPYKNDANGWWRLASLLTLYTIKIVSS